MRILQRSLVASENLCSGKRKFYVNKIDFSSLYVIIQARTYMKEGYDEEY